MAKADGQLLAPRKNKRFENSKSLSEKTAFDGEEASQAPMEQMGKNGYRETTHALGILGDEDRRGHGYIVQYASAEFSAVHHGMLASGGSNGQKGGEA